MKKLYFLALLLSISTLSISQTMIGITGGLSLATMSASQSNTKVSTSSVTSGHVGFIFDHKLNDDFYFQPQILLSGKGGKGDYGTMNAYYLEVPLNFVYKYSIAQGRLFGGLGPYVGAGLFGNNKLSGEPKEKLKFGYGDNSDINLIDAGINFILGYEISSGFLFNINYSLGLSNDQPSHFDGNIIIHMRYFGLNVGYLFE